MGYTKMELQPAPSHVLCILSCYFVHKRSYHMYIHMYAHVHVWICTVQSTDKIKRVYLGKERKERRKKKKRAFSLDFWGPWMTSYVCMYNTNTCT